MSADVVQRHLATLGHVPDPSLYAEDLVVEFPYAPRHHTQALRGRDAYIGFLTRVVQFFSGYQVGETRVYPTTETGLVVAEYPGSATSNETGKLYKQNYVAFFSIKDGKISHIREYYDPVKVLVATDEIPEPGG